MTPLQTAQAFEDLHEISTNLHRIHRILADFEERLQYLLGIHDQYYAACAGVTGTVRTQSTTTQSSVGETLAFLMSRSRIRKRWAAIQNERAKIRINLYFQLASQADNRTNLRIANLTTKISAETQRDSSSMIT
jgi:hypothetical protein